MEKHRSRLRHLPCSDTMSASLAFYAPESRQALHQHDYTQISFLLSGEMLERHRGRDWTPPGAGVGVKPAGLPHENKWGPAGVLIFSAKLADAASGDFQATEPGWAACPAQPLVAPLVRACLDAADRCGLEEALVDLLALPMRQGGSLGSPPPRLEQARQAILEQPDAMRIAEAARLAGLHRVRFSTLFRHHYGIPPSLYRLRALTARAVGDIALSTASLTYVAHDCGFSDQSHLTRSVKRATGLSPKRLRALLA